MKLYLKIKSNINYLFILIFGKTIQNHYLLLCISQLHFLKFKIIKLNKELQVIYLIKNLNHK